MALTLDTARLLLRNFRPEDTRPLHRAILQYQATPYAAYDTPWPATEEGIAEAVAWFMTGDRYLAVCRRDTGLFLGFVCLNPEEAERTYNLGYIFDSEYHGQGYAIEACRGLLAYAFGELAAQQVNSGTPLIHDASIRLLKRLGFVQIREDEGAFQLTREEWERQQAASSPDPFS